MSSLNFILLLIRVTLGAELRMRVSLVVMDSIVHQMSPSMSRWYLRIVDVGIDESQY